MNTGLIYGEFIPIAMFVIATIMLIEAGGNVDEDTMIKLPGKSYSITKYCTRLYLYIAQ